MMHCDLDADRPITRRERRRLAAVCIAATLACLAATQTACDARPTAHGDVFESGPAAPAAPASESTLSVMRRQKHLWSQMMEDYPGVHVAFMWMPCDEVNAYYIPGIHGIVMCAEMLEHPGLAMQAAAHEFGHAITDQRLDEMSEYDADELGLLAMARHGYWDDMLDAALYIRENWTQSHIDGDPHPPGSFRAWELVCAESGAEAAADPRRPASQLCDGLYRTLVAKWDMLLMTEFSANVGPVSGGGLLWIHPTPHRPE